MRKLTKSIVAAVAALTLSSAFAQTVKTEDQAKKVIKHRQSVFTLLASNMGPLGAMAKGKMPLESSKIEKYATRIEQLSLMMPDYTKFDTSHFKLKTEALPKIWQEPAKFAEKVQALQKAAAHLRSVANSGDKSTIKKAIGGVGRSCKGCHDAFKAE
ncbi:c-type cytochrome [Thalassotalea atypica]|uniref:c-type cytochrome n=1 Tax=Thalassotalea atypica TaxID=2054316 RepID=UPI0025726635|nr:cytochrome c [Thalassotalea atypica]